MTAHLKLTWYDDMKAETDMLRMAVVTTKVVFPFSRIDLKESQVNGARINDAIRTHKVEDYMQGFRNGDTFPRPIVHKTAQGYVILSGNQRCEAIRRLIELGELPKSLEIEAYLVETKDKLLLETIARSANVAHGEGDTKDERMQQALYCINHLGMAMKDAAKSFLVSESGIRGNINAERVRSQLQRSGVAAHAVPNSSLIPLSHLEFDESAQMKIGSLAAQHNPTAERVKQVVASVKKETTASGRAQKIKQFERELAEEAQMRNGHSRSEVYSKVPLRPRRDKFNRLMTSLLNLLESGNAGEPFSSLEQIQITTTADVERIVSMSKKIRYRLGILAK